MSEQATPELEQQAREMGWRPQAEFKGDPNVWVDAAEFVRRGQEVLPIVKAENRRLHDKLNAQTSEIASLKAAMQEQRQSMDSLVEMTQQQLKDKLAEQRKTLTAQLRVATREEDDALAGQIEDQLERNREEQEKLNKPAPAKPNQGGQPAPAETPEYRAWVEKNSWFGGTSALDKAKTAAAMQFGQELARAGKKDQAFFDALDTQMAEAFPQARRPDPTEDGRPSGGGGSGSSKDKDFNALPAEAKAKCKEQAARFVGPNKMFKTEAEWQTYYAKQYNAA